MAQASKNSRTKTEVQKHFCPCGGEVKMKSVFSGRKLKNQAVCDKCGRVERRPRNFS
jgi:predicted RNA-binding Zn-ribbon protein involved in translation (DUF1610 family)